MFFMRHVVMTIEALNAMTAAGITPGTLLNRHQHGDWGDIPPEDRDHNERALADGGRLMSVYALSTGAIIWIITELDRSVTNVLLPEEY